MTAYDVVFSKEASARYMQKEAGLGSIIKGIAKGIQRARNQRAIAKEWRKAQKFKDRHVELVSQANAERAASNVTLNDAAVQSGWSNLAGNIKGSQQAEKAKYLQTLANDAEKSFIRRQMAIEKRLVAQGATKEQARAITRNVNAQKYLKHGDADGAMKLQATRDRRLKAVADGRARQQAAQDAAAQAAAKAAKPTNQAAAARAAFQSAAKAVAASRARQQAAQAAAKAAKPGAQPAASAAAAQATQPAVQAANNALNGGGGFFVTFQ